MHPFFVIFPFTPGKYYGNIEHNRKFGGTGMKRLPRTTHKWHYNALSFAFPFLGMLVVMICCQFTPFGKFSTLYSDMYHQYFPFFKAFRASLLSGDSLLYNWNIGLGVDNLGLYSYYLASPLNLMSILVPEPWLLGYFALLLPIKMGLASMFFGIFLQKVFHKQDLSIPVFSSFYGLCAWAMGYQWNIMWLDTFALLPLVMLGMVLLLREKKFILYTVTLFLSVAINYYVGLFTCIFVFLAFFCYEICRFKSFGKFFGDLLRIALFSTIAIGMTAIISLPTLAALQNTQSSVNTFPEEFRLNMTKEHNWMGLLKTMVKVAGCTNGGITPTYKDGIPNIYCGLICNVLIFLFLLIKQIRLRDKICGVVLLLFFNASFVIRQLDYVWHGFHFTNQIPYRFSFLYSFVALYMAYAAWVNRRHFKLWQIIVAAVGTIGLMFCYQDLTDVLYWAYNAVFLVLYIVGLILYSVLRPVAPDVEDVRRVHERRVLWRCICTFLLLGAITAELILNLCNFGTTFSGTNISNYPKGTTATKDVVAHMKEREKDNAFYRAEVTHSQSLNDGALNNYYGISTFTSSANVKVTNFMRALGYSAQNIQNRYTYEEGSPVGNLFLGLKYMIERDGNVPENAYFDDVYSNGNVHLLENNAYLPLGYLANSQLLNVKFTSEGYRFSFQNTLLKNASGVTKNAWYTMPGKALTITGNCPSLSALRNSGSCDYTTGSEVGSIVYTYTANRNGFMCINLNLTQRNAFIVKLNGKRLYGDTYSLTQMLGVGNVREGDVVEIEFRCDANQTGNLKVSAAIMDEAVLREAHKALSASVLNVTDFSNTEITGTIDCNRDGVLYTSIPQDGNWHAYVDGQEVDTVLIGDAMMGLLLPEGAHTIRFVYRNKAFALGWKISLGFALAFVGILLFVYKPKFRFYKGKYTG